MYPLNYSIIRVRGYDQIRIAGNPMYINVYLGENMQFFAAPKEKQYYGECDGFLIIFETAGYSSLINPFFVQGVYGAIQWYARTRLSNPSMKIRLTDPRRVKKDSPAD